MLRPDSPWVSARALMLPYSSPVTTLMILVDGALIRIPRNCFTLAAFVNI